MVNECEYVHIINSYIKTFVMNFAIYYCTMNIMAENKSQNKIRDFIFIGFNVIISAFHMLVNDNINPMLFMFVMYLAFSLFVSHELKSKIGYTAIVVLISYAISSITLMLGLMVGFWVYKVANSYFMGTLTTSIFQIMLVAMLFKIRRLKNGFEVIYKKFNKDEVDTIVIYLSIVIMLMTCFMGNIFSENENVMKNMIVAFIILGITMYIMIHRTITMQYKHSLLLKTLEEYKEEITAKDKEIERLSAEKFNTSKIRHEFFNRQKALELMVKQNIAKDINKEGVSENILNIVNELTEEYSKECEMMKGLTVLPKTDLVEIDNMFKYMQTECAKNNIGFKLNIQASIHPLINNHISKSKLETLLGDHIRNAINVLNKSNIDNKEILVVLGLKDGNYEICILDNGVEFSMDVLLKLGKEQVTTGGTGIGFIITFETLRETKASLVITEYKSGEYTKSVTFSFNNKQEYCINSYRANEIKNLNKREEIIINNIEG